MINQDSNSCLRLAILVSVMWILIVSVLGFKYWQVKTELKIARTVIKETKFRSDVANFGRLFVDNVLVAKEEVDFETRLKLENEVRNLKDEAILKQWNSFVSSQDEAGAQVGAGNLLSIILSRISVAK